MGRPSAHDVGRCRFGFGSKLDYTCEIAVYSTPAKGPKPPVCGDPQHCSVTVKFRFFGLGAAGLLPCGSFRS